MIVILTPQTAAAASSSVDVHERTTTNALVIAGIHKASKVTLFATGLADAELAPLEISHDGVNWTPVKRDGAAVEMSGVNNVLVLDYPGLFRINKPLTAAAAGVYITA